jgi:hypothetical protein
VIAEEFISQRRKAVKSENPNIEIRNKPGFVSDFGFRIWGFAGL